MSEVTQLKQMMREWEQYHVRCDIYDRHDPRAEEARSGILRIKAAFAMLGFDIGTSDFGRLQLTLIDIP